MRIRPFQCELVAIICARSANSALRDCLPDCPVIAITTARIAFSNQSARLFDRTLFAATMTRLAASIGRVGSLVDLVTVRACRW